MEILYISLAGLCEKWQNLRNFYEATRPTVDKQQRDAVSVFAPLMDEVDFEILFVSVHGEYCYEMRKLVEFRLCASPVESCAPMIDQPFDV